MMKHMSLASLIFVLFFSSTAAAQVSNDIEQLLKQENLVIAGEVIMAQEIIVHVYQDNAFKPYWTDETNIHELLQLIEDASDHGLDPADYNIDQLQAGNFPRPASQQDPTRNPGCALIARFH